MGNFDSDVSFTVEMAFADVNPFVQPDSTHWVDITGHVKGVNISRGRTYELDEIDAGTATVRLDNRTRLFDPTNTGSTYAPYVRPKIQGRINAVYSGTTYPLYYGYAESWPQSWQDGQFAQETQLKLVDGFDLMAWFETATTHAQEDAGNRTAAYLDEISWPSTWRNLSTGAVDVVAFNEDCASVLSAIRRVVDTEHGLFFMAADGRPTFQGGKYRAGGTPGTTFSDTGQVPYVELDIGHDTQNVWNDITVGGVTVAPQAVEDTGSIDRNGRRKLKQFDLLYTSASTATAVANRILGTYKNPQTRVERIELTPRGAPAVSWPVALGAEISDLVRVRNNPSVGSSISEDVYIEGITHDWTVDKIWTTEFTLSPTT